MIYFVCKFMHFIISDETKPLRKNFKFKINDTVIYDSNEIIKFLKSTKTFNFIYCVKVIDDTFTVLNYCSKNNIIEECVYDENIELLELLTYKYKTSIFSNDIVYQAYSQNKLSVLKHFNYAHICYKPLCMNDNIKVFKWVCREKFNVSKDRKLLENIIYYQSIHILNYMIIHNLFTLKCVIFNENLLRFILKHKNLRHVFKNKIIILYDLRTYIKFYETIKTLNFKIKIKLKKSLPPTHFHYSSRKFLTPILLHGFNGLKQKDIQESYRYDYDNFVVDTLKRDGVKNKCKYFKGYKKI